MVQDLVGCVGGLGVLQGVGSWVDCCFCKSLCCCWVADGPCG